MQGYDPITTAQTSPSPAFISGTPLLSALSDVLGPAGLLLDKSARERHAKDASGAFDALPMAVLRPSSTEQLSAAMRLCWRHDVAMIPQGGRTGLSGGASTSKDSVAISLERMAGVIEVDKEACSLTAWAGTPLQHVQEAARENGLDYPVDIGARGSATIGGTAATNAGGIRVLRYGMTRQNILGLETVLADGTVMSQLGKLVKDNAGFDLKQLFIGSEGTLGIITRLVLKLVPRQNHVQTVMLALRDYPAALDCLSAARAQFGEQLTAFEGLWPDYWHFVCHEAQLAHSPFAEPHGFYVLMETAALENAEAGALVDWLGDMLERGAIENAILAQSLSETASLWAVREAVGHVDAALGYHINFDLGIAPSRLGDFCTACDVALRGHLIPATLKVGHIGDGNVHLLVPCEADAKTVAALERVVYDLVAEYRGTITAEHGVGTLKREWLNRTRSRSEIDVMRAIKSALDPKGLLNPGKVI